MQWDGIEEVQRGQRAPAEPLCDGSALGPLWVNVGPINAGAQVLATWQGGGAPAFSALARPSRAGCTMLLNFFPPSNNVTKHQVQDRLWDSAKMDGVLEINSLKFPNCENIDLHSRI